MSARQIKLASRQQGLWPATKLVLLALAEHVPEGRKPFEVPIIYIYKWVGHDVREVVTTALPQLEAARLVANARLDWPWVTGALLFGPIRKSRVTNTMRLRVFERDGGCCHYCGETDPNVLTIDHRVPLARGGEDAESNLVTCCRRCNCSKRDRPYEEFSVKVRDPA